MPKSFDQRKISDILLSIASNNHTFNEIQGDTGTSPRILRQYLNHMKKKRLIAENSKNWQPHKGMEKPCCLTENGGNYLFNNALLNSVDTFTKLVSAAKSSDLKEFFRQKREDRIALTQTLLEKHIETCHEKGLDFNGALAELEAMDKSEVERLFHSNLEGATFDHGMDKPLFEAVKKLFELQLYLNFQADNSEELVRNYWAIFAPGMRLFYLHKNGTRPALDKALDEIQDEILKN